MEIVTEKSVCEIAPFPDLLGIEKQTNCVQKLVEPPASQEELHRNRGLCFGPQGSAAESTAW